MSPRPMFRVVAWVGENWLALGGGGSLGPLSRTPPPILGSRDGALKKDIDGGKYINIS